MSALRLIDIDSHVLEPPDLWTENIEPQYRDRALRFEKDDKGWEYMCVDNRHHHGYFLDGGIFGRAGAGQPDPPHPIEDYLTPARSATPRVAPLVPTTPMSTSRSSTSAA